MARLDEIQRRNGDIDAIIAGLLSDSALFQVQSICGAVNHNTCSDAIKQQLIRLTDNGNVICGYSVSQFSIAALDKLFGIKYTGDDVAIIKLLKANKWFEYED